VNSLKIFKNLKNTEFKILMINPGVVAAIRVVGVRGEPCGVIRWTVFIRNLMALAAVFVSCCLRPLILILMYLGCS